MHPLFKQADELSSVVIGAAIEVHKHFGPGLMESIYERSLLHELQLRSVSAVRQQRVLIRYKDFVFEETLKFDVLVEGCLLVEAKCVQEVSPKHKAQLLSYMKLLDIPVGLLFNFHELKLTDGLHRLILRGANI
jgi:GxxExxY protein